jgi:hypothetical protein
MRSERKDRTQTHNDETGDESGMERLQWAIYQTKQKRLEFS